MEAAKSEDYDLAFRYLAAAEKSAPLEPEVLAALGEVHANAGHTLAALAWKEAWLYAVPKGTGGERRVLADVEGLKTSANLKLGELSAAAQEAADGMSDADPDAASLKRGAEDEVLSAEIKAGMTSVALAAVASPK